MHVRICGGPGWGTTQVYPARISPRISPTPDFPLLALLMGESLPLLRPSSTQAIHLIDSVPHWYKTGEHVTRNLEEFRTNG